MSNLQHQEKTPPQKKKNDNKENKQANKQQVIAIPQ